jgi:hypothetical protein
MAISGGYIEHTMRLNELSKQLIAAANACVAESSHMGADDEEAFLQRHGDLPERLRNCMLGMSNSKALEMSQDIPILCCFAAKVALILHGPTSDVLTLSEKDLYYYRAFPSTQALVLDYDRFKAGRAPQMDEE